MAQTLVVKIGTSSLTGGKEGNLALATIAQLVEVLCHCQRRGDRVVLVSSGAVGVGAVRLGLTERPQQLAQKQAVAAVGQGHLMRMYDDLFSVLRQPIAQILVTRQNFVDRQSYLNIYNTFQALFELGVIPIVNENDTVAVDELKFGDNDTLSALVASLVEADWLFLLTDVDRLYSADPRIDKTAVPIERVVSLAELAQTIQIGAAGSPWGTGGMATKIRAAEIATEAGVRTVITDGRSPTNLLKILAGEPLGTHFEPRPKTINARKRWIARALIPKGELWLDEGAVKAITVGGKSLLAAGITRVAGEFQAQDAVKLCDPTGTEIARGLVNYNSEEIRRVQGQQSSELAKILGYAAADTIVHRDNLVVTL
ncbi:glutamate 5-kinase [Thermosynechococcus sp. CL-1]|uniref:glutamate 5-kinase n=1 Tax=unclassified Thermosynechococcus TaxID=2622553 RepID=UPI00122E631D|nr:MULTISPECIES: glutamate 5-kinase [unclassified Thermosynechococcus]QEQ00619.1 glutamate 5-kinase [Thermosynechococcus sp. CL-1]WJI27377.1 glutamate 5-kinase [Thermosynechococcus sp. B1]WJI29909.1 glutamate 5-kinase [Thermosynechococcus sp. B3]